MLVAMISYKLLIWIRNCFGDEYWFVHSVNVKKLYRILKHLNFFYCLLSSFFFLLPSFSFFLFLIFFFFFFLLYFYFFFFILFLLCIFLNESTNISEIIRSGKHWKDRKGNEAKYVMMKNREEIPKGSKEVDGYSTLEG